MPEYMLHIIAIALLGRIFILSGKGITNKMQGGARQIINHLCSKGSKNLGLEIRGLLTPDFL